MSTNPAQELSKFGQSVWYDNISREIIQNGELKRLIAEWGVVGITSNPTIFDNAISKSTLYDEKIARLKGPGATPDKVFEEIAISDIGDAADMLLPIFEKSNGLDGFVSIEVSPLLAADTRGSIEEGKRLFQKLNRKNIMIKIPGTAEGLPAIRALLEDGIHVNVTLLFSVENYTKVARTYCDAMRTRVKQGLPAEHIRSVASFFVSRVDTSVDKALDEIAKKNPAQAEVALSLRGKFGIANCKLAYKKFQEIFEGAEFSDLKAKGVAVQRPLWASTSTKNPAYRDVFYLEGLIGPHTVNTIPHATLGAFADHGVVASTLTSGMAEVDSLVSKLKELGVNLEKELEDLQIDGVKKFSESFVSLNNGIAKKLG